MRHLLILTLMLMQQNLGSLGCSTGVIKRPPGTNDPATRTERGCSCKTQCKGSLPFFKYDLCYTENNCGTYSWSRFRYFDLCNYLADSQPMIRKTWQEKTEELMRLVKADKRSGEIIGIQELFKTAVKTSYDNEWDVMPTGRRKVVHSVGGVCKFELDIQSSIYTGMLKNGTKTGIIRLGSARDISNGEGVKPGAAVKFLRTGIPSGNFFVLNNLNPIPNNNYNFFELDLFTHIQPVAALNKFEEVARKAGNRKFMQAQECTTKNGLSDVARYDENGNEEQSVIFPFKITLAKNGYNFRTNESSLEEFSKQWNEIPKGTAIYSLKAHSEPTDTQGTVLGKMVVDGCTTSKFGDERLFFRHQRIEEDIALRPEWTTPYLTHC